MNIHVEHEISSNSTDYGIAETEEQIRAKKIKTVKKAAHKAVLDEINNQIQLLTLPMQSETSTPRRRQASERLEVGGVSLMSSDFPEVSSFSPQPKKRKQSTGSISPNARRSKFSNSKVNTQYFLDLSKHRKSAAQVEEKSSEIASMTNVLEYEGQIRGVNVAAEDKKLIQLHQTPVKKQANKPEFSLKKPKEDEVNYKYLMAKHVDKLKNNDKQLKSEHRRRKFELNRVISSF